MPASEQRANVTALAGCDCNAISSEMRTSAAVDSKERPVPGVLLAIVEASNAAARTSLIAHKRAWNNATPQLLIGLAPPVAPIKEKNTRGLFCARDALSVADCRGALARATQTQVSENVTLDSMRETSSVNSP